MSSEAKASVLALQNFGRSLEVTTVAHERTPFTEASLQTGEIDALIAQHTGHLVRSAIRRLKGIIDNRDTLKSQETIRTEILLKSNL